MQELQIKEEFENLIRPLTEEEFKVLEKNITTNGCREPITILEDNTIIDGHNRYEICRKHNIGYSTFVQKGLETEADVKLWMIENQLGKRNLPTEARLALVYRFKEIEAEKAKLRQSNLSNLKQFQNDVTEIPVSAPVHTPDEKTNGRTLEVIAKMAGVSARTADQYDKIQRKGTEEQKAQVDSGESSIKKVYTQIQRAERLERNQATEWPKGKYRVIYADPPWKYDDERSGMGGAIDQYDLMELEDIKALPVKDLAETDAVLFMWATAPLLKEGIEVVESWGFKYKTHMIWNKTKGLNGHYVSPRHELLFIATKGSGTPDTKERPNSVQTIERTGRHSEKPEDFRKIIETLYTYGNKVELFARKAPEGWVAYGNEIYKQKKSKPEESAENEPTKEVA